MPDMHWDTKITEVTPTSIRTRGYPIDELMGNLTFSQVIWLLLMGELPNEKTAKVVDAILVSTIDHGPLPPSIQAARTVASTGGTMSTSVAAGVMSINRHHGGATEACFNALHEAVLEMKEKGISVEEEAIQFLADAKTAGRRIPGYGHQFHEIDPRTIRLFDLTEKIGTAGDHQDMAVAIENEFKKRGRTLPLNIAGAMGAVLGDLGVPPELMNGFFMISRVPGLVAHVREENNDQKPMRKIHPTDHGYIGETEKHLG